MKPKQTQKLSGFVAHLGKRNLDFMLGQQFGRLTVIARAENNKHGAAVWVCRCRCGGYAKGSTNTLRRGWVKSCGCLLAEKASITGRANFGVNIQDRKSEAHKNLIRSRLESLCPE